MSAGNNATDGGWIMHHFTLYINVHVKLSAVLSQSYQKDTISWGLKNILFYDINLSLVSL